MEATAATPKREGEPLAPEEQPPSKQQKQAAAAPVPSSSMAAPMMDDSYDDDAVAAPSGPAGGEGGEGPRRWMAAPAQPKAVRLGGCVCGCVSMDGSSSSLTEPQILFSPRCRYHHHNRRRLSGYAPAAGRQWERWIARQQIPWRTGGSGRGRAGLRDADVQVRRRRQLEVCAWV